jgi:hypothetical protein
MLGGVHSLVDGDAMKTHPFLLPCTSEVYDKGWADYRSALYLSGEEIQHLDAAAERHGPAYHDEWRKGWDDAAEADDTLMD